MTTRFRMEALGRQRFRFIGGDGHLIADHVRPDRFVEARQPVETEHPVEPTAATPRWYGDRLDREWAISVLSARRARFRSMSESDLIRAA